MRRAVAVLLPAALLLTGCFAEAEPPDDVDEARLAALLPTLWFAPERSTPGGPEIGEFRPYARPGADRFRTVPRTVQHVAASELAAAREAGWVPVFGLCPGAPDPEAVSGGTNGLATALVVQLTRDLGDAPAFARIEVRPSGPETHLGGSSASVDLSQTAYTLYHLDTDEPGPMSEAPVEDLACVSGSGTQDSIGTPVTLREEGIVDEADKAKSDREREERLSRE